MGEGENIFVVLVTAPDAQEGERIGKTLVEEGLAACVNIIPDLRSLYLWKGELCNDSEVLLVIKTLENALDSLTRRVQKLHPYEVPEVLWLQVTGGSRDYLDWVIDAVKG